MTSDPIVRDSRAPVWQHALAALGYLFLTSFYMRPVWRVFGTHIGPDPLVSGSGLETQKAGWSSARRSQAETCGITWPWADARVEAP